MRFIKNSKNVTDSTVWGNYYCNEFKYNGKYYMEELVYGSPSHYIGDWYDSETSIKENEATYILQTGACNNNQAKNIYDLAGNITEWTMENWNDFKVCRGGYYEMTGDDFSASAREGNAVIDNKCLYGFRPALYVTAVE